eukprot:GDKJ01058620.1.p1 GENE.GDKJ01058620.1~~GDKJ01058620.1.p1  ORF type:complete len:904 (-),score=281.09 GDKJ01058620.1:956-3640(-)
MNKNIDQRADAINSHKLKMQYQDASSFQQEEKELLVPPFHFDDENHYLPQPLQLHPSFSAQLHPLHHQSFAAQKMQLTSPENDDFYLNFNNNRNNMNSVHGRVNRHHHINNNSKHDTNDMNVSTSQKHAMMNNKSSDFPNQFNLLHQSSNGINSNNTHFSHLYQEQRDDDPSSVYAEQMRNSHPLQQVACTSPPYPPATTSAFSTVRVTPTASSNNNNNKNNQHFHFSFNNNANQLPQQVQHHFNNQKNKNIHNHAEEQQHHQLPNHHHHYQQSHHPLLPHMLNETDHRHSHQFVSSPPSSSSSLDHPSSLDHHFNDKEEGFHLTLNNNSSNFNNNNNKNQNSVNYSNQGNSAFSSSTFSGASFLMSHLQQQKQSLYNHPGHNNHNNNISTHVLDTNHNNNIFSNHSLINNNTNHTTNLPRSAQMMKLIHSHHPQNSNFVSSHLQNRSLLEEDLIALEQLGNDEKLVVVEQPILTNPFQSTRKHESSSGGTASTCLCCVWNQQQHQPSVHSNQQHQGCVILDDDSGFNSSSTAYGIEQHQPEHQMHHFSDVHLYYNKSSSKPQRYHHVEQETLHLDQINGSSMASQQQIPQQQKRNETSRLSTYPLHLHHQHQEQEQSQLQHSSHQHNNNNSNNKLPTSRSSQKANGSSNFTGAAVSNSNDKRVVVNLMDPSSRRFSSSMAKVQSSPPSSTTQQQQQQQHRHPPHSTGMGCPLQSSPPKHNHPSNTTTNHSNCIQLHIPQQQQQQCNLPSCSCAHDDGMGRDSSSDSSSDEVPLSTTARKTEKHQKAHSHHHHQQSNTLVEDSGKLQQQQQQERLNANEEKKTLRASSHLSFGTQYHRRGTCTPCQYEWSKGCHLQAYCRFCHDPSHDPKGKGKANPSETAIVTAKVVQRFNFA